jgi:micrococcal nuclease
VVLPALAIAGVSACAQGSGRGGVAVPPLGAVVADTGPRAPVRATVVCVVTRIVDGDTIACEGVGTVRLIGIDTPESSQPPFGAAATAGLASMLPVGTRAQLERDVESQDQYGRALGYIWVGSSQINWLMVRLGWAVLLTYPPNVQYVEQFRAAEARARAEKRGLWAIDGFVCVPIERRRGRC